MSKKKKPEETTEPTAEELLEDLPSKSPKPKKELFIYTYLGSSPIQVMGQLARRYGDVIQL